MKETTQHNQLDSGAYEIIRKRLLTQKEALIGKLQSLNNARKEVFNSTKIVFKANARIHTQNNYVAGGSVAIDNSCSFGYNVHFGLRTEINLEVVFSIYHFDTNQFVRQSLDFLNDSNFNTDYQNLYK